VSNEVKSLSALAFEQQDGELLGQPAHVRRVGKYRIVSELGRGGAATVYLAFARGQSRVNKLVVLKALLPESAADAEAQSRFLDEARVAAQLNHANVVQTYEVGVEGDRNVIVMEYLEGHTLNQVVRRAKAKGETFPLALHLNVLGHALEGIHYAHEYRGYDGQPLELVHRDVSPQNIFLTYDGQVKVLDFGIAKVAGASAKTQIGTIRGKIAYMAPEQMRSDGIDRRADIFSIGCMLWAIATGTKLWKDATDVQIIRSVIRGEIPSVESANPDCDPDFARIVNKAVAFDPANRYATALELQADLHEFCIAKDLHASHKDLGNYVSKAFAGIRAEIKSQVEREISRIISDDSSNVNYAGAVSALTPPALVPPADPRGRRSARLRKYVLAALVLGSGIGAVAYWLGQQPSATSAPLSSVAAPVILPPKTEAMNGAPAGREKGTVQINFRVSPPGASITVDGRVLPPGTTSQTFPSDDATHVLKVESAGLPTVIREFALTRDDTLDVHLAQRSAPVNAPANAAAKPPPRAAPPPPAKPAPAHATTAAPAKTGNDTPAKPDCESPSYFDANGIKRFRPECL
jgi:serine/threonine-protein kinase